MKKIPPPVLVKTWLSLVAMSDIEEVSSRAKSMLFGAFDTTQDLVTYCEEHAIDLAPLLHKLRKTPGLSRKRLVGHAPHSEGVNS